MSKKSSFEKRIKRHIIGPFQDFFIITGPGFEKLCYKELISLGLSIKNINIVRGGVEFTGKLPDCYLANLYIRTASRILMRIKKFKATNFSQLQKKLSDFSWELYLYPGIMPEFRISTSHSRLYHKDAIKQRFIESIASQFQKLDNNIKPVELFQQKLFIRVVDDNFIVSIDSSGDNLYKRGIKKHRANAPLRETIAACALMTAGYNGCEPLIDPMCGSGTFSLEAAMMAANIPPGSFRDFAFMQWPCFMPKTWAYIKRKSEKNIFKAQKTLIFASDKNKEICINLKKSIKKSYLNCMIQVSCHDFFDICPQKFITKGLIAINPPYGLRIGTLKQSMNLFYSICQHLKKEYKGWKFVIIAPNRQLAKTLPFKAKSHIFFHGGLKLILLTGKI